MHVCTSKNNLTIHDLLYWRHKHTHAHTHNNRTKMVFIEACLGPVHLVWFSRTRSPGQNWTPSMIQTVQTPSRPGSRRTKSAGRKLAGEDPPLHRPLCAQTLSHSTTLRADAHFLPQPPARADHAHNYTPLFREGGGASSRPSVSHWLVSARKSLVVSLTGQNGRQAP